jgi:hypothetical protein
MDTKNAANCQKSSRVVMAAPPLNVLYYGREDPLPDQCDLKAGPLSATFEQGQLLNIRWHGQEILRRIYAAVRDRDWGTVPLQLSNLQMHSDLKGFQLTFDARHQEDEIDFAWRGRIEGTARGRLTFSMEGEALSTFFRSRIGFCLLHSVKECVGRRFSVLRPDRSVMKGFFPEEIAREAPIAGTEAMSALGYDLCPGLQVNIQFQGDIFQMEDQRAWTDASFKTFCTPLHLPCPVQLRQGTRVSQTVRLVLNEDGPPAVTSFPKSTIVITVGTRPTVLMSEIGLGIASHEAALTDPEIERLRMLRFSHLRVDLKLWEPGWRISLQHASQGDLPSLRDLACQGRAAVGRAR